jgi:hypothetical protein
MVLHQMIPSLVYLDRYRNEGTRPYSQHAQSTEALEKYRPNSNHPQFELAVFELPRDAMQLYTANPSIENIMLPIIRHWVASTNPFFKIRKNPQHGGLKTVITIRLVQVRGLFIGLRLPVMCP